MGGGIKIPELGISASGETMGKIGQVGGGIVGGIFGGPAGAMAGSQLGGAFLGGGGGTNISDSGGMQGYTDLANQASQGYKDQNQFMGENVNPRRKQLIDALSAQVAGTAPSIAEAQLKSAFDKSLQQQLAGARSSRTGNAGLASRNFGNIAAQQGQNLAGQSAIARLQEQRQAQEGLQNAISGEMNYSNNLLGNALTGQGKVAEMQNAQRDKNDKRNSDTLEAVITGGIKAAEFFSKYAKGGKVKKMADGGAVSASMDMNAADSLLKSKYPKKNMAQALACGGQPKKMFGGGMAGQNEFDIVKKQSLDNALRTGGGLKTIGSTLNPQYKNGQVPWFDRQNQAKRDDLANRQKAWDDNQAKNPVLSIAANMGAFRTQPTQRPSDASIPAQKAWARNERGNWQAPGSTDEYPDEVFNNGGNVPGKAKVPGDNLQNDTVPAILSPGEIVVPRSVVEEGPVAAAHFVKEASNDESYNADTFHAQKKSFASMLKSIKDDERKYGKISEILKSKKV